MVETAVSSSPARLSTRIVCRDCAPSVSDWFTVEPSSSRYWMATGAVTVFGFARASSSVLRGHADRSARTRFGLQRARGGAADVRRLRGVAQRAAVARPAESVEP